MCTLEINGTTTGTRYPSWRGCLSSLKFNLPFPPPPLAEPRPEPRPQPLPPAQPQWSQGIYSDLQASGTPSASAISSLKDSQNSQDKVSRWLTIPIQSRFSPRLIPAVLIYIRRRRPLSTPYMLLEFPQLFISIIKNILLSYKNRGGGEISIKCATVLITNTVTYIRPSGNTATEYKQDF